MEHRVAGADANPYLALAAVLAAAHFGIVNELDPGPATIGNGYDAAPDPSAPTNWFAAVDRFAASEVMQTYLGERFVRMFSTVKRTEQRRFFDEIPALDYDWCLRNA